MNVISKSRIYYYILHFQMQKTIDLKLGLGAKITITYEKRNVNTISYGIYCIIHEKWKEY